MEHHKEACEFCVFEEKCSSYEKNENTNCIQFVDLNFEVEKEIWFEANGNYLNMIYPWMEMSDSCYPFGVKENPVGGIGKIYSVCEEEDV